MTQTSPDAPHSLHDDLAQRVERLLGRHSEMKRTIDLLERQVSTLADERDLLHARLHAASQRVDALLEKIKQVPEEPTNAPHEGNTASPV